MKENKTIKIKRPHGVSVKRLVRPQNQSENATAKDKALNSGLPISGRGGFLRWLHDLENCEECLSLQARTIPEKRMYESALRRWKEAGYPYPGEWPDTAYSDSGLEVSSYTREWVFLWSNSIYWP